MTYSRFAQLWRALVTDRTTSATKPDPLPDTLASPQLEAALIKAGQGDHSAFDHVEERLAQHDLTPSELDIREHRRQIGDPSL